MKIVVGLGNPGKKYHGTRHNVGFAVIDGLASGSDVGGFQERFDCEVAEWRTADEKVLLAKPETFMNLSGQAVRAALDFYQLSAADLLVVCDDFNLPLGKLRFRARGSHGGHNGLRDIQQHLGTTEYSRLRIGVDAPPEEGAVDFVLGKFRPSEKKVIEDAIAQSIQGVVLWVRDGIEACMNQCNA
ncbi:MAG: aminoacyl-tRNA hydrolase [Gemmataceae bacterium]|nr:aminoacyl-tRNA hydrolase [Gemmataceae bacterium]MCI0741756.1 aminoacyl-tRNA hydrolase [Gemmataceae bacterium]